MTKLGVNIDKVATLRNTRGGSVPNAVKVALDCESLDVDGIAVRPRSDERHIRRSSVYDLRPLLQIKLNIEGYPSPELIDLVLKVRPHQMTLVPDDLSQIASNLGWDTKTNLGSLTEILDESNGVGIRTSVFVAADVEVIKYVTEAGADRVELYVESYAIAYPKDPVAAAAPLIEAAEVAHRLGIGPNAGHDSSLLNLNCFYKSISWLGEVPIGHTLISDTLYLGLGRTIQKYKNCLR